MFSNENKLVSVLITGGAGLIGTATKTMCEKLGWKVYTLDLKSNDLDGRPIDFIGDITTINSLEHACKKVDGVIHLAAVSRVIDAEQNKPECTRVNVGGTKRLLETVIGSGCKWFIFGSSREVYGEPSLLPVKEEYGVTPINHYGHAKVTGENIVTEYCSQNNIAHANMRFSNVYGHPRDHKTRLINAFIWQALKSKPLEIHGGGQVFDFTHVKDTANAITEAAQLLNRENKSLPPIHVLPGKPVAIEDLADLILDVTNSVSRIVYTPGRDYDVEKFYGDPSRLNELLDFYCEIDIEDGVKDTVALFEKILE